MAGGNRVNRPDRQPNRLCQRVTLFMHSCRRTREIALPAVVAAESSCLTDSHALEVGPDVIIHMRAGGTVSRKNFT